MWRADMKNKKKHGLFPKIRIVTLDQQGKFDSPYCTCVVFPTYPLCTCDDKLILPIETCSCDTFMLPRYPKSLYCNSDCDCDCVHCRCDCDDCLCDCDHCRCDCDFCSCVSKGGYSPDKTTIVETCAAHFRTFFRLSEKK